MRKCDRVIPIFLVSAAIPEATVVEALIREIGAALARYAKDRRAHVIDISAMPLTEPDRRRLDEHLGRGEVTIEIDSLLHTRIEETCYAGVWRVRHYDSNETVSSERIEIGDVPDIVRAQKMDIKRSAERFLEA